MTTAYRLLANLPNLISIGRLVLVPTIVWLVIIGRDEFAFWLFVLAGASDAADGFLARKLGARSRLGAFLDPLADKVLLVSIYVALAVLLQIPAWLAIMVVSRDVLIVGAVLLAWVLDHPIEVRPLAVSKVNTVAQIGLAAAVLADLGFTNDLSIARNVLVVAVAGLTVASMVAYVIDWVRHMERA